MELEKVSAQASDALRRGEEKLGDRKGIIGELDRLNARLI